MIQVCFMVNNGLGDLVELAETLEFSFSQAHSRFYIASKFNSPIATPFSM